MQKRNTHTTPARFLLSLLLISSTAVAGTALGANKKPNRPSLDPATSSLPAVGGTWSSQGPGPILNGQVEGITNGPVVGAVNAVAAHPTNADIVWIGSVNGGIWKTTNATNASPSWTAQTDTATSLSISDIQRDPTDATHNTLVASTGGFSSYGVSSLPGTIFRTTNGGANWTESTPMALNFLDMSGIAARGSIVVVSAQYACGTPIFRSTDFGASFAPVGGLPSGGVAYDIAGDPTNNAVLYTAIRDCFSPTLNGIYKSTDTGATWTRVSNSTMNGLMTNDTNAAEISVGNSGQVFAGIVVSSQLAGIFRSANGGSTWTQLDTPTTTEDGLPQGIHPGFQGSIHFSLAADPSNSNLVYVGGDRQPHPPWPNSIGSSDWTGRLFRVNAAAASGSQATSLTHCQSATAACNFSISTFSNSTPHADSRVITFNANGELLEGDDGGIYRRSNPSGSGDWFSVNGSLRITEIHNVVYDRVSSMIMSGHQDNGTAEQTTSGGSTWSAVLGGDGGDVSADDITSSTQSKRYGSYQYLDGFFRRTMNTSGVLTDWRFPARTVIGGGPVFEGQFTTPVELNRIDARRILFAGWNDVYESLDRGDTVTALGLNRPLTAAVYGGRTGGVDNLDLIYGISNLTLSPFAFQPTVLVRTAGGGAPVPTGSQPTATDQLQDIAVDVADSQKVYVVTGAGTVFSSSNGGASWTNVTGNLPSGSTRLWTIVHIPGNPSVIAVGGANGVFRMATNNPGSWNQLGTGMSNAIVYDLDYDPLHDVLVAGTLGRGAWKLTPVAVSAPLPSLSVNDIAVTEGNSGSINATFTVSLSSSVGHTVGVDYTTSNGTATGQSTTSTNASGISIPDSGNGSPYPSSITVSGITDPIKKVTVTLSNYYHTYNDDVDVLLVGPGGQTVVLMSDAGSSFDSVALDLTFDDAAATNLPQFAAFMSSTYRPTNYDTTDTFGAPAPGGPYGTALSVFNGTSANGTWNLYVVDDAGGDFGGFYGGWSLSFTSGDYSPTSGHLIIPPGTASKTVSVTVHGDTTFEGDETFFLSLSGPSNATIFDFIGQATIVNDDAVPAPTNVAAVATTPTNVQVSWTAVPGASSYKVFRSSGGGYTQIGSPSGSPFNDSTVSANTAYLYKVRAATSAMESPDSNVDLATTVLFTDPVLTAGVTKWKAVHLTELLTAVNAVRALAGLGAVSFTPPSPAIGVLGLGAHVNDLRNGLNAARSSLGLPAQSYTDPTITVGVTKIKTAHINDLRNGVQ